MATKVLVSNGSVIIKYRKLVDAPQAVKDALEITAGEIGTELKIQIIKNIATRKLIKTGNLMKGIGIKTRGKVQFRVVDRPSNVKDSIGVPKLPLHAMGIVYMMPRYSGFLETGTVHMAAKPFFYSAAIPVQGKVSRIYKKHLRIRMRKGGGR